MIQEIDVSSHNMAETMAKDRRRRSEAKLSEGMGELDAMLLPLAVAVARLSARIQVTEAVQ